MAPVLLTAMSFVVQPNDRLPLNYRLINEAGSWKVYDVMIGGVSLVERMQHE